MKRIAIVGAGHIGSFIAEHLTAEQFDVVVIDRDADLVTDLQDRLDVVGVVGNATSFHDLQNSEILAADLLLATTRQDESNLVSCLLARELGIPYTVAITRFLGSKHKKFNPEQLNLGIDQLINSSEVVTREIMESIEFSGSSEIATFEEGNLTLIGYHIDANSAMEGHSLTWLKERCPQGVHLANWLRRGEVRTIEEDEPFKRDDYLYILASKTQLPAIYEAMDIHHLRTRTAIVYGDNYLSQLLTEALLNQHFRVTVLVRDETKKKNMEGYFNARQQLKILAGDKDDLTFIQNAIQEDTSLFISASTHDPENLVACLIAKQIGVEKTIAVIRRNDFLALGSCAGVDFSVAPRLVISRIVEKIVHGRKILDYHSIVSTSQEVFFLEVYPKSKVTLTPFHKVKWPSGVVIGGVLSGDNPIASNPRKSLQPGDKAIVFTDPAHIKEVEKFFV